MVESENGCDFGCGIRKRMIEKRGFEVGNKFRVEEIEWK